MKYEQTIRISKEKLDEGNDILSGVHSCGGKHLICNVKFPNKFQADIEINKAKQPWVQVVLFDLIGNPVGDCQNNEKQIIGRYRFHDGINEYFVCIECENR